MSSHQQMAQNKELLIPIDIKDVKLVDWLVDRAIVNRLWNEECGELRDLLKQVKIYLLYFINY